MIRILVGCQIDGCAEEVSYPLDMVAMYNGAPICETCYDDANYGDPDEDGIPKIEWSDLPSIKLSDLHVG